MKRFILIKRNGQWFSPNSDKPFSGVASCNGFTYRYTLDGRKVLLSKPRPDPQRVVKNLWQFENPQRRGFVNGLYYPFVTANGNTDIGAGIDMSKQTAAFRREAQRGLTPQRMNQELNKRVNEHLRKVDTALRRYTNYPDTVSPQIKEGLADLCYQVGSLGGYPKLLQSVAKGDLNGIQRESRVMFKNKKGQMQFDKRRYDARNSNYFYFRQGGMISPLMESIMPNTYKESRSEPMKREQTRRAAQKIQQKAKAIESYTNVRNNISASLAKPNSLLR
ncbi:hypothetical protein [uncultured Prevotella sp.]|uniref:hypothetical protein n=1 Tax=uncultured Prevotella sp. TaxID=159272 RepID=UPI0026DBC761|nr:hypothetical protein [uncultured Prevotella sp.]